MTDQLLIVDDEILECQYIQSLTDWMKLGIDRVYTANSMEQAVSILKKEAVSVVLCDIEMPRQSGMELLSWIRSREYHCEVIFITCHASFEFAQKAIRLGSSDYLLKPVEEMEMVTAIHKALERFRNTVPYANRSAVVERFLGDAAQGRLRQDLQPRLAELGLQTAADEPLGAALLFFDWPEEGSAVLTSGIKHYMIENIVSDMIFNFQSNVLVAVIDKASCLTLAPLPLYCAASQGFDASLFRNMMEDCRRYADIACSCVLALPCLPREAGKTISDLFAFHRKNICITGRLIRLGVTRGVQPEEVSFDTGHWAALLAEGDIPAARAYFDKSMEVLVSGSFMPASLLAGLFSELIEGVYRVLRQKNTPPHEFLSQDCWKRLHSLSLDSLHGFCKNIHMLMNQFDGMQTPGMGQRIKSYVLSNLGENITREDVARHVSLTPEYISKVFKKETGITLSEYIIQVKIDAAKQLLSSSKESISSIAVDLGYNSFSFFTKQFREQVGITPSAYRRQENPSFR